MPILFFFLPPPLLEEMDKKKKKRTLKPIVTKEEVVKVQDGDTINLKSGERIRFFGIDAPETFPHAQPYGKEAKERVLQLISESNMEVHLLAVNGGKYKDKYGRFPRIVFVNKNTDLNLLLLKEGLAWAYRRYLKGTEFEKSYVEAEEEARRNKIGLWGAPPNEPPVGPEEFRRTNKKKDRERKMNALAETVAGKAR